MNSPIAIVGGAGRVGGLVARRLAEESARVRVVSRNPRRGALPPAPGAEVFEADVRDADSLHTALGGCAGVVYSVEPGTADSGPESPESTMFDGVRNVIAAATAGGRQPYFVLISQIFVTRRQHPMNAYGRLLDWRLRGEDAVRESGLPYSIIRPSWLTDSHFAGERIRIEQGDGGEGWVCRADVAQACVHALRNPAAANRTFELYNEPGAVRTDWAREFARLAPDRLLTGRGAY